MSLDPNRMAQEVADRLEAHRMALRENIEGIPVPAGMRRLTDDQFVEFMLGKLREWPPMPLTIPIVDKDGDPVLGPDGQPAQELAVVSPFMLMLAAKKQKPSPNAGEPLIEGGEAILARWEKLAAAAGGAV